MKIKGFTKDGNWYKGNLHSHSTNSDGKLAPEDVVKLYQKKGYSFICLSEHDLYTDYTKTLNTDNFVILPGLEASAVLCDDELKKNRLKVHHIHGILGTKEMQQKAMKKPSHGQCFEPKIYYGSWEGEKVAKEMVENLREYGMFVTYNHPLWSRVTSDEFTKVKDLWALEIYNYGTDNESKTGLDTQSWDLMLREGKKIYGFAADDNHNKEVKDVGGGYVMVKAQNLSHESIVEALLKGNYYSSSGPLIYDFYIEKNYAYIKSSKAKRIDFIVGGYVDDGISILNVQNENNISKGKYKIKGHEKYIRAEITDKNGKKAWTNPIFLFE